MDEKTPLHEMMRHIATTAAESKDAEVLHRLLWESFQMLPNAMPVRFVAVSRFIHTFLLDEVRLMEGLDAGPDEDIEKIKTLLGALNQFVLQD